MNKPWLKEVIWGLVFNLVLAFIAQIGHALLRPSAGSR